jgi:hypothetical protein
MKAKPKTRYVTASPATWELIRAAYLAGQSAPTAAARFGVSVGALRKRAEREGWTKRAFVAGGGRFAPPPPAGPHPRTPAPQGPAAAFALAEPGPAEQVWDFNPYGLPPWLEDLHRRAGPSDLHDAAAVTQLALRQAVRCLVHGDATAAARHAQAAAQINRLAERLPPELRYAMRDDAGEDEARQSAMDELVFQIGAALALRLLDGGPIREPYLQRAERWRRRYLDPNDPARPPRPEDFPDDDFYDDAAESAA